MKNLNYYYQIVIKQDLINKFNYKTSKKIPQISKIGLNITPKNNDLKQILTFLLALELIASQKAILSTTKKPKIILKMKKGLLSGCRVTLKKKVKYDFLSRLIIEIFPELKQSVGFQLRKNKDLNTKVLAFSLMNLLNFPELEANYSYFTNLSNLNIIIVTNVNKSNELIFLLKSFKIPIS